ncbi:MAG: hypothetical protein CL596_05015 [Alteromonas sp.]|nr:hypothetical protein [Alteromonas sp.]
MIKPFNIKIERPGLNIITGKVGSGKTTIPSVISWTLFGKTLKENSSVSTWEEKRPKNYKGTKTGIIFYKDKKQIIIIRCKDYKGKIEVDNKKLKGGNNIFIFIDGKHYTKARNKSDKKEFIEKLLGYSFDLFKTSIVFGQKMKKIIEETGPHKKKVFEEAFEVDFVEIAKTNTENQLSKLTEALTDYEYDKESKEDKIEELRIFYSEAKKDEANFEKDKKESLKEIDNDIKELNEELISLNKTQASLVDIKPLEKKLDKLKTQYEKENDKWLLHEDLESSIETIEEHDIKKLKKKYKKDKVNYCNECGGKLSDKDTKLYNKNLDLEIRELVKKSAELKKELGTLQTKDTTKLKKDIKKLKTKISKKENKNARAKGVLKRLPKVKEKISDLTKRREKLSNKKLKIKSTKYKSKIDKLEKKITGLNKNIRKLEKEIEIQKWLIKDPLSNNGLKAYMFNSLLTKVNDKLIDYSRILGFQVEFGIDLSTARKDFYQAVLFEDVVTPYEDLSGGQKQLVDTSVAFAIHDVISEIRPTNLLFLDEPFESLGVDEIEIIEELVEEKAKNKSLYLITHQQGFSPRNANKIHVKRNNKGQTILS